MRLRQVAVRATDLDRAQAFYGTLLGAEPTARFEGPGLLFFVLGDVRLLLDRNAPASLIYLEVDSIAEVLRRLGDAAVVRSPEHVIFQHADDRLGPAGADEVQAFVEDPFGTLVGLVEFRTA